MPETSPLPTPLAAVEAMALTELDTWFARMVHTLDGYAGEGVCVDGREDPAELLCDLGARLGIESDWSELPALYSRARDAALCALHPGVVAVIEGSAVVVPKIQSRCVEAGCPSFGERVSDGCMCFREAKDATRKAVAAIGGVI
jgi:hypothetical protein